MSHNSLIVKQQFCATEHHIFSNCMPFYNTVIHLKANLLIYFNINPAYYNVPQCQKAHASLHIAGTTQCKLPADVSPSQHL